MISNTPRHSIDFTPEVIFNSDNHTTAHYIFNSGDHHDIDESNKIFLLSDIIITDVSGVASTSIFLGKKLIFLEEVIDVEKRS